MVKTITIVISRPFIWLRKSYTAYENLLVELEQARRHHQNSEENQVDHVVEVQRAPKHRSICGEGFPEHRAVGPQGAIEIQSRTQGIQLYATLTQKHEAHLRNLKLPPKQSYKRWYVPHTYMHTYIYAL